MKGLTVIKKKFKGLDHYGLQQDEEGNVKLNNYEDVLNARRAKVNILMDNASPESDTNFIKLNQAISEKFQDDQELLSEFDREDREIAQKELIAFNVLENIDDLTNIKSEELLEVSLLLSELSFIEKNIMLNTDANSDLAAFKNMFIEKKASGEEYSNEEHERFLEDLEKIDILIKLELESRIEGIKHDGSNDDLRDEIAQAIDTADKTKKNP